VLDRGHRRRGRGREPRAPRSLDQGGVAAEEPRWESPSRGERGEVGSSASGRVRDRRLRVRGWEIDGHVLGWPCGSRSCRAGPRAWLSALARPAPLGRANQAHHSGAGPGVDRAKKRASGRVNGLVLHVQLYRTVTM
jgi:hypothetical protein